MDSLAALFSSLLALTFVVVPLDDRPVTAQLPRLLGAIAGVHVAEPPRPLLGRYLRPGDSEAILRWLRDDAPRDASAYVVSNDMIVYGGLVASRVPGVSRAVAYTRIDDLADHRDPSQWVFFLQRTNDLHGDRSIGLRRLRSSTAELGYSDLAACVEQHRQGR